MDRRSLLAGAAEQRVDELVGQPVLVRDIRYELQEFFVGDDRAMAQVVMSGRQTGAFVVFPRDSAPVAFPPTGREFAVRHAHLLRFRDGLIVRHSAVRDDLGMLTQLGHLPPGPAVLLRTARWNLGGGARRAVADAVAHAARGAATVAAKAAYR